MKHYYERIEREQRIIDWIKEDPASKKIYSITIINKTICTINTLLSRDPHLEYKSDVDEVMNKLLHIQNMLIELISNESFIESNSSFLSNTIVHLFSIAGTLSSGGLFKEALKIFEFCVSCMEQSQLTAKELSNFIIMVECLLEIIECNYKLENYDESKKVLAKIKKIIEQNEIAKDLQPKMADKIAAFDIRLNFLLKDNLIENNDKSKKQGKNLDVIQTLLSYNCSKKAKISAILSFLTSGKKFYFIYEPIPNNDSNFIRLKQTFTALSEIINPYIDIYNKYFGISTESVDNEQTQSKNIRPKTPSNKKPLSNTSEDEKLDKGMLKKT